MTPGAALLGKLDAGSHDKFKQAREIALNLNRKTGDSDRCVREVAAEQNAAAAGERFEARHSRGTR